MAIDLIVGRPAVRSWKFEAPPTREPVLARPRLMARLDETIGKRAPGGSVFLVTAPAGYGKSTMVAQWAQAAAMPTAWLHLDVGDDDPATLAQNLTQALRRIAPRSAQWQAASALPRTHTGALTPGEVTRVAEALATEIGANITRPSVLTLTGAADLTQASGACALLDGVLARPVDHLRIILESREAPQLTFSHALAQRRLYGLGAQELRLTNGELEALLTLIDAPDDAGYRTAIHDLCAGWITGVLLATGGLWPKDLPTSFLGSQDDDAEIEEVNQAAVADYLAREVLDSLGAEELSFAIRAATLSYMTAPLCERLLDEPEARRRLIQLERRTGLVTRIGRRPDEARYRFQPFLRAALLNRLDDDPEGRELRRDLHARAGALLAEAGDIDEALAHHGAARQFYHMVALIEEARGALLRAGQGATLERWLRLLPPEVRERQPHLVILLAELARQRGRMREAYEHANRACALTAPLQEVEPQLMARALAIRADVRFTLGEYAACQRDCEAALAGAPDDAYELHARARFTLAQALNKQGRPEDAEACLIPAERYCQGQRDLWLLARLHYFRSRLTFTRGDYIAAESHARDALRYGQEADDEIIAIGARLQLGALGPYLGQTEQAREQFERAREQAERSGYLAGETYALVNLADLALRAGAHAQAAEQYARAIEAMHSLDDQRLTIYACAQRAIALALAGEHALAEEAIAMARARVRREDELAERNDDATQIALAQGVVAWRQGDVAVAISHLDRATRIAQICHTTDDFVSAQRYRTMILIEQGRTREAEQALTEACETTRAMVGGETARAAIAWLDAQHSPTVRQTLAQLDHPVAIAVTRQMATLSAVAAVAEPQSAARAQRRRGAQTASRQQEGASSPDEDMAIRIYTLGEPRVLVGAESVELWRRPQARDLLIFLAEQGHATHKEVILETLWPDRAPDQAERAFKKARHNLRELMQQECLVQQNESWKVSADCWTDARAFEALAHEGAEQTTQGDFAEAAHTFQRALSHWHGPYLTDSYSDWIVVRRDELQQRYIRCLERAAEVELACQRWESAAQLCYRILETDALNENAYRGLMSVYALKGAYADAAQIYQRCVGVVRETLQVEPDPKTYALWQTIQAKSRQAAARAPATRSPIAATPAGVR
ncbi:MAG TPA: BTAD domain-containing putative transcriptional regulator [Ktedonobacterales bacterium]|nr:BTAD domain-containing putative transcriptional regulator [Ktedonobacterales bacterium]